MFSLAVTAVLPAILGADLTVQDADSSFAVNLSTSIFNLGSLIGDYDAETNPGGTITIPGAWGGGDNQAIPIEFTSGTEVAGNSNPRGGLGLEPFEDQGTAILYGIDLDGLNGSTIPVNLSLTLLYETFHTQNPTALFPGGVPITLPIGEATLDTCQVQQTQSVSVPLEPLDESSYSITAAVPVVINLQATYQGQPLPLPALPAILAVTGEYSITDEGPVFVMTYSFDQEEVVDLPGDEPLPPIPVELPTLIPPGSVANVLISLIPDSSTTTLAVNGTIVATGEPDTLPCDATGDGVIDANDILAVLADWGPCPGCDADTNGDNVVDVNDILDVLECWPS
ncbi:MAG: hypothetical protein MK116_02060 [Phycisphaerales bacterium]|nr:hypothetical protein [Phycisphaerales bacterium]